MPPTYPATVIVWPDAALGTKEHCLVNGEDIASIGRVVNQQVRIVRSPTERALYTVKGDSLPLGNVQMMVAGWDRLGGGEAETVTVDAEVTRSSLTDAEAQTDSEFVERLTDNGKHHGLIALAPHGGMIERYTDMQAECVGQQLAAKCVSVWRCKGWKSGGGAYDRWHITSTEIHEESFPLLQTVIDRGFKFAVAFHGWTNDHICIGGLSPASLKQELRAAIEAAIDDSGILVVTDADPLCPDEFNGNHPNNLVNRLSANGIQIEQSLAARTDYWEAIADAVAGVLGPKVTVCTAPVFEGAKGLACLGTIIGYIILLIFLLLLIWIPGVFCVFKGVLFRIAHACTGNSDPCIEL
ncbi:MAG: poly-gamma-glutamate hydrolase family protein [bacterium]